jgi:predicted O-linked N-acetylglucosamine transferase (SPINDLY family)
MTARNQAINKSLDALREGDAEAAIRICRRALRKRAGDVELIKLLGHALLIAGKPEHAADEARKAVAVAPEDANGWRILGYARLVCRSAEEAIQALERAIQLDAQNASSWHELALARTLAGATSLALDAFTRAHDLAPKVEIYRNNYLLALIENGKPELAQERCLSALDMDPNNPELIHLLGQAYMTVGDLQNATETLERASSLAPDDYKVIHNLGICLLLNDDQERALPLLQRAAKHGEDQKFLEWTLVKAHAQAGHAEEAVSLLQKRHEDKPTVQGSKIADLIKQLIKDYRFVQANSLIELAMSLLPKNSDILGEAAHLALQRFNLITAKAHLEKGLSLDPENDRLLQYQEMWVLASGEQNNALSMARSRIDNNPESNAYLGGDLPFLNYFDHLDPQLVSDAHRLWGRSVDQRIVKTSCEFQNNHNPERKLRIGYVSPDFREHSVAYFFEPVIRHHDRDAYETHCYYLGQRIDRVTNRIRHASDYWHHVQKDSDDRLISRILADEIDILVDLVGHTKYHRLEVFARRAAPVQITWLGYPNTTGLKTMDYRFCDPVSDPEGPQDDQYSETLYRLPSGFLCYEGPDVSLPQRDTDSDSVTFGSFNNLFKVTDSTLRLWGQILAKVPRGRLVIKAKQLSDPMIRKDLKDRLEACGIESDRVGLYGRLKGRQDHLEFYGKVDIALDTMPYNGTTTTCEALWMGVPVIGMRGDRHAARVTASILTYANLPELIGEDENDFLARAVALANDRTRLSAYHVGLRAHLRKSTLCDTEGFTHQLENAFHELWCTYLERTTAA